MMDGLHLGNFSVQRHVFCSTLDASETRRHLLADSMVHIEVPGGWFWFETASMRS